MSFIHTNTLKLILCIFFGSLFIGAMPPKFPVHHFIAYIKQNGKQLPINYHVVKVKREPFEIVVDMPDKEGVFVNISFSKNTYKNALKNIPFDNLQGFSEPAIYEVWKNPNKELLVSNTRPCFWFIESSLNHRFSNYEWVNKRYICTRKVDAIYDINKHKAIEFKDLDTPIYLTFIKFKKIGDNYRAEELMRHEFKVEWVK
jgi:hypothetical protein